MASDWGERTRCTQALDALAAPHKRNINDDC
jgi:hypothetical protein